MSFFGIDTWEFLIILVLALVVIGPDKLPEYVAKLRTWIRQARDMADGARSQLKDQMGPEFKDVDWKQYDPRQYDPRKIVRQALFDDPADPAAAGAAEPAPYEADAAIPETPPLELYAQRFDPDRATPWDLDAT